MCFIVFDVIVKFSSVELSYHIISKYQIIYKLYMIVMWKCHRDTVIICRPDLIFR